WSGGLGTFSSNADLNAVYTPHLAEVINGSVTLTLSSTGNNTCAVVEDQITIVFTPAPTIDLGSDIEVCANAAQIELEAEFTVTRVFSWCGGAGNFSPYILSPNVSYTPNAAEIAAVTVTLSVVTTGFGNCFAVEDEITITILPEPTVSAG